MSDDDSKPSNPAAPAKKSARKPRKRSAARGSKAGVAGTAAATPDATSTVPPQLAPARGESAGVSAGDAASAPSQTERKARGKSRGAPARSPDAPVAAPTVVSPESMAVETEAPRRLLLSTRLDVRWGDMDAFKHVNNAVFLSYLEEARLRWLQGLSGPWLDDNTAPLLAAAHVDYRRPIEWPCTLAIELYADRVGNSSLTLGHRIVDAGDADVVFSEGHTVMVWIDRRNGKGSKLPEAVRGACSGG